MTLRFEAEVQTAPKGPFERCIVTAEAGSGDFWSVFNVVSVEKLPPIDHAAIDEVEQEEVRQMTDSVDRIMKRLWSRWPTVPPL